MKYLLIILLLICSDAKSKDEYVFSTNDLCELGGYYMGMQQYFLHDISNQMLSDVGIDYDTGRCYGLSQAAYKAAKRFSTSVDPSYVGNNLLRLQTRFTRIVYRNIIKQLPIEIK